VIASAQGGDMSTNQYPVPLGPLDDIGKGAYLVEKRGVSFSALVSAIEDLTATCKSKIAMIRSKRSAMSIADMFDLQMAMNRLSQLSEMSTAVISAMNSAITTIAKGVGR